MVDIIGSFFAVGYQAVIIIGIVEIIMSIVVAYKNQAMLTGRPGKGLSRGLYDPFAAFSRRLHIDGGPHQHRDIVIDIVVTKAL